MIRKSGVWTSQQKNPKPCDLRQYSKPEWTELFQSHDAPGMAQSLAAPWTKRAVGLQEGVLVGSQLAATLAPSLL